MPRLDAKAFQGLAKSSGKAHVARRRTGQFRTCEVVEHGVSKLGDNK